MLHTSVAVARMHDVYTDMYMLARRWAERLEAMLEERGVDLSELRSEWEHHPSTDLYV